MSHTPGDVAAHALASQARVTRWVLWVALVLVLSLFGGLALIYWEATERDNRREADQHTAVQEAMDGYRRAFAELTGGYARELAALGLRDRTAVQAHLAPGDPPSPLQQQRAYVVAADASLVASFPPHQAVPPVIAELVASYRQGPGGIVASDFVDLDGVPAIVAMAGIPAEGGTSAAVLARVRVLEEPQRLIVARSARLRNLEATTGTPRQGRAVQAILNASGRLVGWLSWERERPLSGAVRQAAPAVMLVGLALLGFAALAVRQMRKTTRNLASSEAAVWRLAHEDTLTGLPNYRRMLELVERALAARRGSDVVTFAYLDLDGFKEINDSLGHHGGDQLLAAVGERLREVMPARGLCSRFGSDEFTLVLTSETREEGVVQARAMLDAVSRPYWIDGRVIEASCCMGLAHAPQDANEREALIHRADLALREAKSAGRGMIVPFAPAMNSNFEEERFLKRELQIALAEHMMDVHYQPIVTPDGLKVVGVEALLRWRHPSRGDIPPSVFIPIAERTGIMDELGAFVLKRALTDARRWPDYYVAVNLSPLQVHDRNLVDLVSATLRRTGIEPGRVVLEITEGVLMENPDEAKIRLEDLRALGVRIALDDFGSGYSSFAYLQRFPFDKLKIDKSFVQSLAGSANGGVIIQAIVALGRALGVTVLVEGVETEQQRVLLRLAGCDEMQGFLFAKPGPREAIDALRAEAAREQPGTRTPVRAIS